MPVSARARGVLGAWGDVGYTRLLMCRVRSVRLPVLAHFLLIFLLESFCDSDKMFQLQTCNVFRNELNNGLA